MKDGFHRISDLALYLALSVEVYLSSEQHFGSVILIPDFLLNEVSFKFQIYSESAEEVIFLQMKLFRFSLEVGTQVSSSSFRDI